MKLFRFLFSSKTYLAFGVEESPNKYPVEKARYLLATTFIRDESLKKHRSIKILDIGCNEGMMILYTRKAGVEAEFYGIDILPEKKEKALSRGYKQVLLEDIRGCDFQQFGEGFFDVVICSHILEHLENPGIILDQIRRIMKKGGMLIVGVPIGFLPGILWRRYMTPLYNPRKRKEEALKRFGHVSFFTLPELKNLLKKHGFCTEKTQGDYFMRVRGFFLENYKWWFDFNQLYGKIFPGFLGHVSVKARLAERLEGTV
ncbi:MAG: class I SAM-dependent methyltransferase [Candidatus Omnitrophota bacterium]|jgi:SAM-dependent methyltransferase